MIPLALALAAVTGIALGLLGGGGSILTVPVFVYVLGFDAKTAIAMSLAVVGVTSAAGTFGHWRHGQVNSKVALTFGSVAMLGTYAGARLAMFVSGTFQLALFALVMAAAAFFMLRDRGPADANRKPATTTSSGLLIAEGVTVGIVTGLVGIGGGFLVVPALVLLSRLPMKEAVGTSLAVIAMKSFAGLAGYVGEVDVPWDFVAGFTATALVGIVAGSMMAQWVPAATLQRAFAIVLIVTSVFMLYENRHVIVPAFAADTHAAGVADGSYR